MTTSNSPRSDPIGDSYFAAVSRADDISDFLFIGGALMSFALLLVDKDATPTIYRVLMAGFALTVFALFVLGVMLRLHLSPRAENKRRLDFFTSALGINLTHEISVNYYNNEQKEPMRRMAAQLLENVHFTKAIASKMALLERWKVGAYALGWALCWLSPNADLGLIVAASQAVFSEQILSRYLRLEWLRIETERIYDDVHQSFVAGSTSEKFRAATINSLVRYETAKSIAAISLSSRIFHRYNAQLSTEWEAIKKSIEI